MATLKEILEAKKQVVEVKKEETVMEPVAEVKEVPAESPKEEEKEEAIPGVATAEEIAASLGLERVPQFRVFNFAYEFKTGSKVLKADKMGVYAADNQADFDYLAWQVKQGRILFN